MTYLPEVLEAYRMLRDARITLSDIRTSAAERESLVRRSLEGYTIYRGAIIAEAMMSSSPRVHEQIAHALERYATLEHALANGSNGWIERFVPAELFFLELIDDAQAGILRELN